MSQSTSSRAGAASKAAAAVAVIAAVGFAAWWLILRAPRGPVRSAPPAASHSGESQEVHSPEEIAKAYGKTWELEDHEDGRAGLDVGSRLLDYAICMSLPADRAQACADAALNLKGIPYSLPGGYSYEENSLELCSEWRQKLRMLAALVKRAPSFGEDCRLFFAEWANEEIQAQPQAVCGVIADAYAAGGMARVCPALVENGYKRGVDTCRMEHFPSKPGHCQDGDCHMLLGLISALEGADASRCPWHLAGSCRALLGKSGSSDACRSSALDLSRVYHGAQRKR